MKRRLDIKLRGPGRITGMCVAALLALVLAPDNGNAQSRDGDIRVVETVDPVSGARYRQAVYDLTKAEIKAVQRALRAEGYLGVGWTGRLDHGTVKALYELQEDRGLYECGCVSYETIVALGLKPDGLVTTVATGGSSASAYDVNDRDGSSYRTGIYYPIAVPIFIPVDPDDPDGVIPVDGTPAAPAWPPAGATPPGVRPLPPPTRVTGVGSRSASIPNPNP